MQKISRLLHYQCQGNLNSRNSTESLQWIFLRSGTSVSMNFKKKKEKWKYVGLKKEKMEKWWFAFQKKEKMENSGLKKEKRKWGGFQGNRRRIPSPLHDVTFGIRT